MEKNVTSTGGQKTTRSHSTQIGQQHYVVAIGASAGGLEAIHDFFDNMAENSNVSFVVIQHLSPDYKSLLVELVSKHTHMKVFEAAHDLVVLKNCVYVIPNNKLMTIRHGRLQLADKVIDKAPNTAIDTFFYSLAEDRGAYAIGVILSGTGTDGTKGADAIRNVGGLVLVQDPVTAKFDGMPNSAITAGNSDHVLSPEMMPEEIFEYIQEVPVHILHNGKIDEGLLESIFGLVYQQSGHDFHYYKTPTIIRRIAKRMIQGDFKRLEDYLSYLQENPDECKLLAKDFLIGVTKFFRDPAAYEILYREIFPEMISKKNDGDVIKIWVSACSTGEEAYSVAMLLDKYLQSKNKIFDIKIFATDLDASSIEVASRGVYPGIIENDVDEEMLRKYFAKDGKNYIVIPRIRKQIVFARHNIIKDPPFIKNDLVTCRNMLIYMNTVLQKKVISTLHFALNPNSFLFLGPSESAAFLKENLFEVNNKWKIYKKIGAGRVNPADMVYRQFDNYKGTMQNRTDRQGILLPERQQKDLPGEFREVLAEVYGYAAFYIDGNYEIRESIGDYKKYLSLPEKKLHLNILKMVPPELSVALNTTIRKALQEQKRIHLRAVKIKEKNKVRIVSLTVKPGDPFTLVVLGEPKRETVASKAALDFSQHNAESNSYIMDLEAELKQTRADLQLAIEGLETANEELQSSNEELLSANEELQSSNEELQSLNEELHTLNTEHQLKIRELVELNDDLDNYFRSTHIAQLFLDNNIRIRKFNPAAVKMVNLIETDIGRPFTHISNNIRYANLLEDIRFVMDKSTMVEKEITLNNGKNMLMRILPYLRQDKQTDGVVISFVDVSALRDLDNIVKAVFNASQSAVMVFKNEKDEYGTREVRWIAANHAADSLMGKRHYPYIGKQLKEVFPGWEKNEMLLKLLKQLQRHGKVHDERVLTLDGDEKWFDVTAVKMLEGFVVTLTDISDKKQAEEKLRRSYHELTVARDNLNTLNEQLEVKISERTKELTESEERFRLVSQATNETIWDWDVKRDKIWWNDSFYDTFGWNTGDAQTQKRAFWYEHIHPHDRKRITQSIQSSLEQKERQWYQEYRFQLSDGRYAQVLDRANILYDEADSPYRILGSILDVSALRNAEKEVITNIEQKTFLAESMPLIVWSASPEGHIDFLNQHFFNYSGLTHDADLEKVWERVIYEEDLPEVGVLWKEAIGNKKDFAVELRLRKYDGNYCWHLLRVRAKKDEEENVVSWVGTAMDVHIQKTTRDTLEERVKERTQELEKSNVELEASNIELQQFASVASHDLKEPLRKIHMFSHLLKERYHNHPQDPVTDYLDRIINSSARMTTLVNDLLTYSRLSVNHLFRLTDLNQIIEEILADLELQVREKNALIQVSYMPQIEAVPGQMRQVFQNLLSNALKFSKKDEQLQIRIDCKRIGQKSVTAEANEKGDFCRISVIDNGIGFDEHYKEKIFTIFQRLHTKEKYEGTGIGLAITKKIIDKHNGLITAKSEEGRGACFVIVLPIRQVQSKRDING